MATLSLDNPETIVTNAGLRALLGGVAVAGLGDTGWIRVTGEDRVRWLNGMATNSIQELQQGQGNYNYFLSAQGRIQGDAYAFASSEEISLQTGAARVAGLMQLLDRFLIMDDVTLTDNTARRAGVLCAGPGAHAALSAAGIGPDGLEPLRFRAAAWHGRELSVIHAYSPRVPRFEIWIEGEDAASEIESLAAELHTAGAVHCGAEAIEALRILEATPKYGVDIRDRDLPQETNQTRALHFSKGCYLGQEIVERIRSRGNVHRGFHAFELTGDLPPAGTALTAGNATVGELTSVAAIPLAQGTVQRGLGYVRRDALERGTSLSYPGGEAALAGPLPALI